MIKPETPDNEHARLASLHETGILDTAREERFDRTTRIAQRLFDVPIALVSIVDEHRQWFKSCFGLPVSETPREISFCGHTINGNEVFVVEDTLLDERFVDNPLVADDPFIRFYAGYPIRVNNGAKIGTLCIIDRTPRRFSEEDASLLVDLGKSVESELSIIEMSVTDPLTKLLNRRGFDLILRNNLLLSQRNRAASTLVYVDLNRFKEINDIYGHQQGDRVLMDFAAMLRGAFRSSDVTARMGGDEFVVLLNNADSEAATAALRALHKLAERYNARRDDDMTLAFSHGSITFDVDAETSIDDLLAEADRKMYLNKTACSAA